MTYEEVEQLKDAVPGIVVEENIRYKMMRDPFLDEFEELSLPASGDAKSLLIRVVDINTGGPIAKVTLYLVLDQVRKIGFRGITDNRGECRFVTRGSIRSCDYLAIYPQSGYWNRGVSNIAVDRTYEVAVRPLPPLDLERYDWGHQFAQMEDGLANGGAGVRIGIIDSGICNNHPDLRPAGGRNCVTGEDESLWDDDDGHGSHCAGIVSALINGIGIKGYVPHAQIYAYRVFSRDSEGALTYDLNKAIISAVNDGCDIISMSLGSAVPQRTIRNSLDEAYSRGVLVVAAAGNEGGSVSYPAAFPEVLGVGAFGKFNTYPEDSIHKDKESSHYSANREYYAGNFSNFGKQVDFCAPGVAILSTVPGGYSAWDGTSMACPQITGIAALALAMNRDLLDDHRDSERVNRLVRLLRACAQPLGFGPEYEGKGCLSVRSLLRHQEPMARRKYA